MNELQPSDTRRILVTGATGLVGRRLLGALRDDDRRVAAVTRRPDEARFGDGVEPVGWDGVSVAPAELAASDGIVHLAGEPVLGGLPTAARRKRILESRVDSTRALVRAMAELSPAERPRTFVCASAVGIYGDRGEEMLDENAAPGSGFLADVCIAWEKAAQAAAPLGVRTVSLRIGVVLAREGGALAPIAKAFRFGLGGRLGSGRQWFPWIHIDDLVGLIRSALRDESWRGVVNATAPNPVRNAEWTKALGAALRRPAVLPVPALALKHALGEMSGELLGSRRVVPKRALELGFRFEFEKLEDALRVELG
jgi:uncharacterized protein (TIGR01777 family)